eukprot:CAMPEP_0177459744 /NCGR_PEP_ID=MMETSP0369-20130122/14286_1 /TAXON_ID=447022 ORGANISM="Scrippsiella hangoei-like, Strain SHHI-4" /NCGR_SAMPLE_ID=MMETSP0369 /ASSEMBLY_ACC=CAM_ASM_000364 /LENGTH=125 /DNA_ID=CAMNT_0018933067 /DNA_START=234 /DNA_END=607 /DNA_ORIENTATION=+
MTTALGFRQSAQLPMSMTPVWMDELKLRNKLEHLSSKRFSSIQSSMDEPPLFFFSPPPARPRPRESSRRRSRSRSRPRSRLRLLERESSRRPRPIAALYSVNEALRPSTAAVRLPEPPDSSEALS